MICVVDASVAIKWFTQGDWATREDHIESAVDMLRASSPVARWIFTNHRNFWLKWLRCWPASHPIQLSSALKTSPP